VGGEGGVCFEGQREGSTLAQQRKTSFVVCRERLKEIHSVILFEMSFKEFRIIADTCLSENIDRDGSLYGIVLFLPAKWE
jgi:hypothetical protein